MGRVPDDLAGEVWDYLSWRGLSLDSDTRHLVRRTLDLAGEIRTVTALARSLYLSRRALGRRFMERGIPVPSHWLHFGRILRAALHLQGVRSTLFDVACALGYPDGFALSNQMHRLAGIRPSMARDHLGWEWVVESWVRKETATGSFDALREVARSPMGIGQAPSAPRPPRQRTPRSARAKTKPAS